MNFIIVKRVLLRNLLKPKLLNWKLTNYFVNIVWIEQFWVIGQTFTVKHYKPWFKLITYWSMSQCVSFYAACQWFCDLILCLFLSLLNEWYAPLHGEFWFFVIYWQQENKNWTHGRGVLLQSLLKEGKRTTINIWLLRYNKISQEGRGNSRNTNYKIFPVAGPSIKPWLEHKEGSSPDI